MSLSKLTASLKMSLTWAADKNKSGADPVTSQSTVIKTLSYTQTKSNISAGGADEMVWDVRSISIGGNETLDLSAALTNVCRDSNITVVRVKGIAFQVLGDGETIGPSGSEITGTLCTGIQIGGEGTHPWKGFFGTTASKMNIISEGFGGFAAIGSGGPLGTSVSNGMNDKLLVANLDGSYQAQYGVGFLCCAT